MLLTRNKRLSPTDEPHIMIHEEPSVSSLPIACVFDSAVRSCCSIPSAAGAPTTQSNYSRLSASHDRQFYATYALMAHSDLAQMMATISLNY